MGRDSDVLWSDLVRPRLGGESFGRLRSPFGETSPTW
jgi:hypothetical protein